MKRELESLSEERISELEMPDSVRTPGRTWTRYPEHLEEKLKDAGNSEPEIRVEGDVEIYRGEKALEKAGNKVFGLINHSENSLNALHALNFNSMIYLEVSGDSEIHIKYRGSSAVLSHLVVDVADNAEVVITEETETENVNTSFTELYVGENASVEYGAVEKPGHFSYSRRKASVDRYGSINWLNGVFTGELNRTKIETVLEGDSSETEVTGVWYPTGEQHHDISLEVCHVGNGTRCEMDSRSVLDGEARSLYEGVQNVRSSAEDTESFQDQETLMLSDRAEADASPKLMIENPGVDASHATASGTVDVDKRHYLESRGLGADEAEKLVVKGFFEPVMSRIEIPEVKQKIREEVRGKLEEK